VEDRLEKLSIKRRANSSTRNDAVWYVKFKYCIVMLDHMQAIDAKKRFLTFFLIFPTFLINKKNVGLQFQQ